MAGSAAAAPGDAYVSDDSEPLSGAIYRIGPAGGDGGVFTQGDPFTEPNSVALLRDGDLVVPDDNGTVYRVDRLTGARTVLASGPPLDSPNRVAVGPDGFVYIVDLGPDSLLRANPSTGAVTTVVGPPAIEDPRGVAISRDGFAYMGTFGPLNGVYKVNLATGAVGTAAADPVVLGGSSEVTLSADERTLWVANRQLGTEHLARIDLTTGAANVLAPVDGPFGIAQLRSGSLLVTSTDDELVHRIGPAGAPIGTFSANPGFTFPTDVAIEPPRCGKRFTTVAGTDAAEVLRGSPFADVIRGERGNDRILGLGGKDVICGGKGKDLVNGGAGKDVLAGDAGRDRLVGGKGSDRCSGGKSRDRRARGCERVTKIP